jgi:hypothetical protein
VVGSCYGIRTDVREVLVGHANAAPGWLHEYNHHRERQGPPITRLTNLPGQYG